MLITISSDAPLPMIDIVDRDAGDVLFLRVMHDRLARREHALGIGIAGRIADMLRIMSCTISSGASKPNTARLPMLSLMILWPSSSICRAFSSTGPRMS